jgi:hypothetical protein
MDMHQIKSLSTLVALAAIVGLAGCASTTRGDDGAAAATGGSSAAAPKYTQCSPEFAVACRS